jgi:phage portal protein BeeE
MSWLQPIVLDIMGDKAAGEHKLHFFEGGGTPNLVVEFNPEYVQDEEAFKLWREAVEDQIGLFNTSNRRLYLGGGTKATTVGSTMEEAQFKAVQGAGETRICMAAGVPPIIIGASEGLDSATYSNYAQARRRFSDGTIRYLWRSACGALEPLLPSPGSDAELWFDDSDIAFLQENQKDAAEIQGREATTITMLTREGFTAESSIAAVENDDWGLLVHTGLPSVQVQPGPPNPSPDANANGSGSPPAPAPNPSA